MLLLIPGHSSFVQQGYHLPIPSAVFSGLVLALCVDYDLLSAFLTPVLLHRSCISYSPPFMPLLHRTYFTFRLSLSSAS